MSDTYYGIVDYQAKRRRVIQWLCLPSDQDMGGPGKGFRQPATLTELAAELEITRETIYAWQRDAEFIAAKHLYKKQTTLDLDDEYLNQISIAMLKPTPTDRIVQVYWRYIHPILEDEKLMGKWEHPLLLNRSNSDEARLAQARAVSKIRELPPQYREMFLNILDEAASEAEMPNNNRQTQSPRRIHTGEEEPATIPALPAPAPAEATPATPRYDPQRGMRKPHKKPR
jgi:6-pyruvoyl-tetrahydropterin synthase